MTIDIVEFPIEHGGSFYSYVTVYRRVLENIQNVLKPDPEKNLVWWINP